MNMAVSTCAVSKDANIFSFGRNDVKSAVEGFEKILQGFGKKSKKDLFALDQDINSVLLQYLASINLIQCPDEKGNEPVDGEYGNLNSLTQIDAQLSDVVEISRLWKALVSSFSSEGKFDEIIAAKFYEALKLSMPEMSEVDFDLFLEQLKNQLNQISENLNIAEDDVTENEYLGLIQAGESKENVKQKDYEQISPVKNGNISVNGEEDYKRDVVITKGRETWSNLDSAKESEIAKSVNYDTGTINTEKTSNNALENDIAILDGILGEVSAGSKANINDRVQTLHEVRTLTAETFEEIVDKIQLAVKDKTSELSLKLKPEYLGNVMIKIISEGDKIRADLFVENAYVHEAVQYHAQELKNQIQQHGYNLTELNVYQTSDWLTGNFNGSSFQQNTHLYHFKKTRYNFHNQEKQIEEVVAKSKYDDWRNTGSINYVV